LQYQLRCQTLQKRIDELEKELEQLKESLKKDGKAEILRLNEEVKRLQDLVTSAKQNDKKAADMLFTMSRGQSKKMGQFTLKRQQNRSEEVRVLLEEVALWLNKTLDLNLPIGAAMLDELMSGVILCNLMKRIKSDMNIGKVRENAAPGSFYAHDNIQAFLKGCAQLGVPTFLLFDSSALLSKRDIRVVVYCILRLAKIATQYGIEPPEVVKLEKEIDALKKGGDAAEGDLTSQKELEAVEALMVEYCEKQNLPKPLMLKLGEYQFNKDTVAHVRCVRGNLLVRFNDKWEDFATFVMQKLKEEAQLSAKEQKEKAEREQKEREQKERERQEREKEEKEKEDKEKEEKEKEEREKEEKEKEEEAERERLRKEAEEEEERRRREEEEENKEDLSHLTPSELARRAEIEAKKEFFFLTALSIKMNHTAHEEVCHISNEELWERVLKTDLCFYQFAEWIERELKKAHLERLRQHRMSAITRGEKGEENRGHRATVMQSLENRRAREKEIKARKELEEYDEAEP